MTTLPTLSVPHLTSFLLLLFLLPLLCTGNMLVSVKLNSYLNADYRKKFGGGYCNDDHSPCNVQLDFILLDPLSYTFSQDLSLVSSVSFPNPIVTLTGADVPNPFPAEEDRLVEQGIASVRIIGQLWHVDGATKVRMAILMATRWFDSWEDKTEVITNSEATLNLTSSIKCAPDYYPRAAPDTDNPAASNCTYCVETAQYTCNTENGNKICKPGWVGENCDTEAPISNCPAITASNSTISPPTYKTDSLTVGYRVTFSCPGPQPYFLSGPALATCLDSGHWDTTVPHCLSPVLDIQDKVNSLRNSAIYLSAGIVAVFGVTVISLHFLITHLTTSNISTTTNTTTPTLTTPNLSPEHQVNCSDKNKLVSRHKSTQQIRVRLESVNLREYNVEDLDF